MDGDVLSHCGYQDIELMNRRWGVKVISAKLLHSSHTTFLEAIKHCRHEHHDVYIELELMAVHAPI